MARYQPRTAPDPEQKGWPGGIKYIIGNEGCERFSFYGMKAILFVYMVGLFANLEGLAGEAANQAARESMHLFIAAAYALALIGALVADRLLGKYRTIISLSLVYCAGNGAVALFTTPGIQLDLFGDVLVDPVTGLYIGLGLIAVGSGGIKPCVSAHVGDQFGKGNWHLLQKVFNAFYFIINFGSAFATIFIPAIRGERVVDPVTGFISYDGSIIWAFGIPGILMGLATIAFWMGRKKFVHVPPTSPGKLGLLDVVSGAALFMVMGWPMFFGDIADWVTWVVMAGCFLLFLALFTLRQKIEPDDGFIAVMFHAVRAFFKKEYMEWPKGEADRDPLEKDRLWGSAARKFGVEIAEGPRAVLRIISVFLLVSVFWALFDQHSSTWIEQAVSMDRVFKMELGGWLLTAGTVFLVVGAAIGFASKKASRRLLGMVVGAGVGLLLGYLLATFQGPDGYSVQPSQTPAANPFLVMMLIPLTTFGLYPLIEKLGFEMTPLRRMTVGMSMAAFAFVAVAVIQSDVDISRAEHLHNVFVQTAHSDFKDLFVLLGQEIPPELSVHVGWQMIPYVIMTLAEVMVSITGLEFAYSQAPKRMKSVIMGFWLLTVTIGNQLVAMLAGFKGLNLEQFFWVFAALMAGAALVFAVRAYFYQYRDYTQ